jgi:hypothetical protein
MDQGHRCQDIESVQLGNVPMDFGSMGGRIAEGTEHTLYQIHQAALLVLFAGC